MNILRKVILTGSLLVNAFMGQAQDKVTLKTLLTELTDVSSVARLPKTPYLLKQVSSYDRHSVSAQQPGWFANEDHTNFIRIENNSGRKEHVMMDEDGPGAIVRFWETTFKRPGTLRIYFDNEPNARIIIPGYDLMKFPYPLGKGLLIPHSSYEAEAKGGSTLYLPMPYKKHCKVTWEDPQNPVAEKRYYQINFRKYPAGTKVETFSGSVFTANKALIKRVNDKLLNLNIQQIKNSKAYKVAAQGTAIIPLPAGSHAVSFFQIKLNDTTQYTDALLRSLFLKAVFDGEQTVYCPLSDFFGSGAGSTAVNSWYRTVSPKAEMISRFVMPYQRSGRLAVVNKNDAAVNLTITVISKPWNWDASSLYFHADWRQENNVPIKRTEADKPIEWDVAKFTGAGLFVGETFSVNNHMHKWYGEGDQKLWVDGEQFPSEYGTGLEDYYNTSWAPVVIYQSPFANATRADNEDSLGENTFTRTRNLDAVPFNKQFHYNVEMLGWENGSADISATIYWYGKKGAKNIVQKPNKALSLQQ